MCAKSISKEVGVVPPTERTINTPKPWPFYGLQWNRESKYPYLGHVLRDHCIFSSRTTSPTMTMLRPETVDNVDRRGTILFNIAFAFIYRTEDSFLEEAVQRAAEGHDTSEEETADDPVLDVDYVPPVRRRSSDELLGLLGTREEERHMVIDVDPVEDSDAEVPGPSQPAGQPCAEDTPPAEPQRPPTTGQRRPRAEETPPTTRRRVPPGPPPTRRETEAEMSGAVSGLLGILRSHEAIVTRQLQDGDRGHLVEQHRRHIEALQSEIRDVHAHYRDDSKMLHEQYRAQLEQMSVQHRAQIEQMQVEHRQSVTQMQQIMQQMHQQHSEVVKLQSHPSYHTVMSLLPFLDRVPSHSMMACHQSLLDAVKQHMETPLLHPPTFRHSQPPLAPWQSSSQTYIGYRGMPVTPHLSGSSTSTASTQDSPDLNASGSLFPQTGGEPNI